MRIMVQTSVILALTIISGPSMSEDFKESVINGYKKRCIEVRTNKGEDKEKVMAICSCESSVLNDNFTAFEFLLAGAKKQLDKPMLSEEEIEEFKEKIKACLK